MRKIRGPAELRFPLGQSDPTTGIRTGQMRKLAAEDRTDLLRGFVSNKTRRKFSAYLVKNRAAR